MRSDRDKNDTYSGDRRGLGDGGMKNMYIKCCMYKGKRHSLSQSTDHLSLAKVSSPHLAPSKLFRLWALLPHKPTHITCPHDFIAHQAIELLPSSYYQHTSIALSPITPLLVSPCLLITMT